MSESDIPAKLEPVGQLAPHPEAGSWQWLALGTDPHFSVVGPYPAGWVRIRLRARAEAPGVAALYLDLGSGFGQNRVVALGHVRPDGEPVERVTWLPSEVTGLRFDPTAGPGGVSIEEFSLTPIDDETGLREAFAHLESHEAFVRHGLRARIAEARQAQEQGDRSKFILMLSDALALYEGEALDPYFHWRISDRRKAAPAGPEAHSADGPLFSILFPVFNCPEPFLDAALASVRAQIYPRWELLAVDDLSSRPHVRRVLERHQAEDSRIRVRYREKNGGISASSNDALAMAQGPFVALFDHDDVLAPDALLEMARAIRDHPQADFFYSDEDKVDAEGHRFSPFFKPDWSREYFLSCMFTCHLGVYRTQLLRDIGGFRSAFDGAQDYDLVLRLIQRTEAIVHVPRILYSWRAHRASTASAGDSKPYAHFSAERAIGEYLDAEGRNGWLDRSSLTGFHVVRYRLARRPLVSLILATAGERRIVAGRRFDLATNFVERLKKTTDYEACEVLVVPSAGVDAGTIKRVAALGARLVAATGSTVAGLNRAAAEAQGEFLLFVHDDVEPVTPEWLEMLLEYGQHEEVGAVGGRLLQPNGRIDQTGFVLAGGAPRRAFRGTPGSDAGYFMSAVATRNYSAVSGACLLTRRALFLEQGGFDESVGQANADVDYCLRLRARGLRIVYVPRAELYHLSIDCASPSTPAETSAFAARWSGVLERDPFYNPNFLQQDRTFSM